MRHSNVVSVQFIFIPLEIAMPRTKQESHAADIRETEESLQAEILGWMQEHRPDLMCVHIPNGAIRTNKERRRMLEQGMTPGMPDLLLIDATGRHGYMEVKTDHGAISMAQWNIQTELKRRKVPWALVRSLAEAQGTLADWGWGPDATVSALDSIELPEWPARVEELPRLLRQALIALPWAEPEAITTKYGPNWVRQLVPTPLEFKELWKDHKADLKKAGVGLTQVKGQSWTATWYFYAKGEEPRS